MSAIKGVNSVHSVSILDKADKAEKDTQVEKAEKKDSILISKEAKSAVEAMEQKKEAKDAGSDVKGRIEKLLDKAKEMNVQLTGKAEERIGKVLDIAEKMNQKITDKAEKRIGKVLDKAEKMRTRITDRTEKKINRMFAKAEKMNKRITKQGNRMIKRILRNAEREGGDSVSKAEKVIEKIKAKMEESRAKITAKAEKYAEKKLARAETKRARITARAEKRIEKELARAEEKREKIADRAEKRVEKELTKVGYNAEKKSDGKVSKAGSAKKTDAHTTSSHRESIFVKKDNVSASPAAKKEGPSIIEKAVSKDTEKSDDDKKTVQKEAKPEITAKTEMAEKVKFKAGNDDDDDDDKKNVATVNNANAPQNSQKPADNKTVKNQKKEAGIVEKKEMNEVPSGSKDKAFGQIKNIFNQFDNMMKGLNKKMDVEEEKMLTGGNKSFGDFIDGLSKAFDDLNAVNSQVLKNLKEIKKANSASDTHKLGMVEIKKDRLGELFDMGNRGSSLGINRIGDSGEGSGNFTATSFMSSMSKNINEGLENYRDAKAASEADEANESKEAKGASDEQLINTGAELSALA